MKVDIKYHHILDGMPLITTKSPPALAINDALGFNHDGSGRWTDVAYGKIKICFPEWMNRDSIFTECPKELNDFLDSCRIPAGSAFTAEVTPCSFELPDEFVAQVKGSEENESFIDLLKEAFKNHKKDVARREEAVASLEGVKKTLEDIVDELKDIESRVFALEKQIESPPEAESKSPKSEDINGRLDAIDKMLDHINRKLSGLPPKASLEISDPSSIGIGALKSNIKMVEIE